MQCLDQPSHIRVRVHSFSVIPDPSPRHAGRGTSRRGETGSEDIGPEGEARRAENLKRESKGEAEENEGHRRADGCEPSRSYSYFVSAGGKHTSADCSAKV